VDGVVVDADADVDEADVDCGGLCGVVYAEEDAVCEGEVFCVAE